MGSLTYIIFHGYQFPVQKSGVYSDCMHLMQYDIVLPESNKTRIFMIIEVLADRIVSFIRDHAFVD